MVPSLRIPLSVVFIVAGVFAAAAKDVSLPKIDLQKLCKQNNVAVRSVITDVSQDYASTCMADEESARTQIEKEWATYPALAKSRCVKSDEFLPGYVEWLACLQMTRDVLKVRKGNAATSYASSSGHDARRECPVVQLSPEGAITLVIACPLGKTFP